MKTAEETYTIIKEGMNPTWSEKDIAIMVAKVYADQFQPEWIPVSDIFPPFGTLILLRGVIDWKGEAGVSYFSDEVQNDYEILEYGRSGYLLKSNSDYLVVPIPNPEEVCSEYITHWMPLPQPPKED